MELKINTIYQGDAMVTLKSFPDNTFHTCVTSPPYYGLRDYGTAQWQGGDETCEHIERFSKHSGQRADRDQTSQIFQAKDICKKCGAKRIDYQIGLEETSEQYVQSLVNIFREVRRVLKDDGTLWLNLGDSYAGGGGGNYGNGINVTSHQSNPSHLNNATKFGLKPKDLIGIPWMVAFALRADGWYLRQDIIWHKPNPMPESVTDRCTKAHEYIFLLSKSQKYYYDVEAIQEEASSESKARLLRGVSETHKNVNGAPGQTPHSLAKPRTRQFGASKQEGTMRNDEGNMFVDNGKRNKRSVWTVTTKPFKDAHFATFPEKLIKPCILAGAPEGGIVLDPFSGSGTTLIVANKLNRNAVGCELNPDYINIFNKREYSQFGMFSKVSINGYC
jgi:DNA modification methylase